MRAAAALVLVAMAAVAVAAAAEPEWRRITGPPELSFPRDHGAHLDVRTEWWYLTAILRDDGGAVYGVQATFFRRGLDPGAADPAASPLRARHLLAGHLAVADVSSGRFAHAERLRRAAGGLAGVATDDLDVFIGDWSLARTADGVLRVSAVAREEGIGVDLELRPKGPPILHGDAGYSRKGADPGNASAYVSWPRLEVGGTLRLGDRVVDVTGGAWFDHEWGTSQLGEGVAGWDWFSLRLDDGRSLMVYRLRREDGSPSRFSSGTLVEAEGAVRRLDLDDVDLEVTDTWESPTTGGRYPSGWRLRVPDAGIDLSVRPLLLAAELDARASTGTVYWEGPVAATGSHAGEGYVEMTGYAGSMAGVF